MLERLREEHDSRQLALRDLQHQLGTSQEREATLSAHLEGVSAQLEQLQQARERVGHYYTTLWKTNK